jgi:cobalt-zinc-cadmium efflux system outer membrane protein
MSRSAWRTLGVPLVCLILPAGAPPGLARDITIEEARRRVLEAHPAIEADRARLAAAEAARRQAGRRANPELGLEVEDFGGSRAGFAESQTTVTLRQPLGWGGVRGARIRVAEAHRAAILAGAPATRADLRRDADRAVIDGIEARERLRLAEAELDLAREAAVVAGQKVRLGASLVADSVRAGIMASRAALERNRRAAELAAAARALAALWGGEPDFDNFAESLDAAPPIPDEARIAAGLAAHPERRALAAELALLDAEAGLARAGGRMNVAALGGVRLIDGADGVTFLAGLTTTLPIADRNGDAVIEVLRRRDAVLADEAALARRLAAEAGAHTARLEAGRRAVAALHDAVIPGAQRSYDEVRLAWERGRLSYLDLLEARRALIDVRRAELDELAALHRERIALDHLLSGAAAEEE